MPPWSFNAGFFAPPAVTVPGKRSTGLDDDRAPCRWASASPQVSPLATPRTPTLARNPRFANATRVTAVASPDTERPPSRQAPDRNLAMELVRTPRLPPWPAAAGWAVATRSVPTGGRRRDALGAVLVPMDGSSSSARARRTTPRCSSTARRSATGPPDYRHRRRPDRRDDVTARAPAPSPYRGRRTGCHVRSGPLCVHVEVAVGPRAKGACDSCKTPTENRAAPKAPVAPRVTSRRLLDRPRHAD